MEDNTKYEELTSAEYRIRDESIANAKPILAKIKKADQFTSTRQEDLKENMAFYQGNQYLLARYRDGRPWVVQMNTPHASIAIDKRVASVIATDYIGELQPLTSDAKEAVEGLQGFLEDEWTRMNMDAHVDEAIGTSAVIREGYVHVKLDTDLAYGARLGELIADPIDTNAILIDPRARDYRTASYIAIRGRLTYEDACFVYPDFAKFFPKTTGVSAPERGEVYDANDYDAQQDGILTLFTVYMRKGKKIFRYEIVEDLMVKEKELKGHKVFPIAQMRWKKLAQSAYGMALMDDLLALQKAISSIESAIANTAIAHANPAMIVRKQSGINPKVVAKTSGAPGVVYVSDIPISEAMAPVTPAKIEAGIVELKKDFENNINKIAGITDPFTGDIGTAGNTAQGSRLAVERAKIIEADLIKNISEFVEQLTMIMIDYILSLYGGKIIESRKVDEASGTVTFLNRRIPSKSEKFPFSYAINLNMKTAYSKSREQEMLLQLYEMERQYNAPVKLINEMDILSKFDLSNKEELIERYKLLKSQSDQTKAQTIMQIAKAADQYQMPDELAQAAIMDVIIGGEETPNLDAFMQQAQQMASQVQSEMQASEQDLVDQGMDPAMIAQAKEQMAQSGQTPKPQDLNLGA